MTTVDLLEAEGTFRSREQLERISGFLEQRRTSLLLEPIASLLISTVLWSNIDSRQVCLWLILVWVGAGLRALLSMQVAHAAPSDERLQEWGLTASLSTSLMGAVWASGLFFMWPHESGPHAVVLVAAITVVVGIVTMLVARYPPAVMIYLLLTFSVGILSVSLSGQVELTTALSVATILFSGMVLMASETRRLHAEQARLRTELDAACEAAAAAQRSRSEFVANMSHELRTPLNSINGFSGIIKDQACGPISNEEYLGYAQNIHDSGTRLLEIVNDILEMSKLETGDMTLEEEVLDVDKTVHSALNLFKDSAEKAGVSLRYAESPDRPEEIIADRRLLKQILANLLSNAVKFTPLGGTVTVDVKHSVSGDFLLIIRDNGIGMAAEEIPTALLPFEQADTSLSRGIDGTGLGLPLVKALVQLHGGEFRLESEPSIGTTAVVTLPASRINV